MLRDWRDALAISFAFLTVIILVQLVATLFDALGFVHGEVQTYVLGICFGAFAPLVAMFRSFVRRRRGRSRETTASRTSVVVVGLIAGALLFMATQATSLLVALVLLKSGAFSSSAVATVATAATAAAAVFAGLQIFRRLDSRRFAALWISALAWLVFSTLLGWVAGGEGLANVFRQASSAGVPAVAGVLVGMLIYPFLIIIAGGSGLLLAGRTGRRK